MEPTISSSLMCLDTTKQVWNRAKEMFSRVGNLLRTYDLHPAFFFISIDDMSLEDLYDKFRGIGEEISFE